MCRGQLTRYYYTVFGIYENDVYSCTGWVILFLTMELAILYSIWGKTTGLFFVLSSTCSYTYKNSSKMKLWGENRGKWKGQQSTGVKPRTPLAWAASALYTGRYCFVINGSYANTCNFTSLRTQMRGWQQHVSVHAWCRYLEPVCLYCLDNWSSWPVLKDSAKTWFAGLWINL